MSGIVEQARAYLPEFVSRRRRNARDEKQMSVAMLRREPLGELIAYRVMPKLLGVVGPRHDLDKPRFVIADFQYVAELAVDGGNAPLMAYLDKLVARGMDVEVVLVELLAPTARRLGVLWEEDRCDFVDVTMGLWRLQEAVRDLSARMPSLTRCAHSAPRALFTTFPGEQHSFGTVIIDEVFSRNGWDSEALTDADTGMLLDTLASGPYDLAGLTVSLEAHIDQAAALIRAMRSVSRNPRLCIMIGGPVAAADIGIAERVGADGTASDAQDALAVAGKLIATNACREVFCA